MSNELVIHSDNKNLHNDHSPETFLKLIENDTDLSVRDRTILHNRYTVAVTPSSTVEDLKQHMCPFFQNGNNPDCRGCEQLESKVRDCAFTFSETIRLKPMTKWKPEFDRTIVVSPEARIEYKKLPGMGMRCNECYIHDRCDLFKPGFECRVDWGTDDEDPTPKTVLQKMIKIQLERVGRASLFEKMDGGVPDQNTSSEMDRLTALIQQLNDLDSVKFTQTSSVSVPKSQTGILSKIFGGGGNNNALPNPVVEQTTTLSSEGKSQVLSSTETPITDAEVIDDNPVSPIPATKETISIRKGKKLRKK